MITLLCLQAVALTGCPVPLAQAIAGTVFAIVMAAGA